MRIAVIAISFVLAACGKSTTITPTGTVLFDWAAKDSSRATVRSATIGQRATKDLVATIDEGDSPFKLDLHIETAPIDYEEDGKPIHQSSAVAVRGTVKANEGWELSGSCGDGPHYQMPSLLPDGGLDTPEGMIHSCHIKHHRRAGVLFTSEWTLGTTIEVRGDGIVSAFPAERVTIE